MSEFENLFHKFDPPAYGWTRFQTKIKSREKRKWAQWFLLPVTACVFAFALTLTDVQQESMFLQQAIASDILFSPFLAPSNEIDVEFGRDKAVAKKVFESEAVVVYRFE